MSCQLTPRPAVVHFFFSISRSNSTPALSSGICVTHISNLNNTVQQKQLHLFHAKPTSAGVCDLQSLSSNTPRFTIFAVQEIFNHRHLTLACHFVVNITGDRDTSFSIAVHYHHIYLPWHSLLYRSLHFPPIHFMVTSICHFSRRPSIVFWAPRTNWERGPPLSAPVIIIFAIRQLIAGDSTNIYSTSRC